jgi:hypothetical protein
MTSGDAHVFLSGALTATCFVATLFFARYWATSRDRFYLFFAAAFAMMGVNWTAVATISPTEETRHYFYVVRLVAFLLLLVAIVEKNRRR